MPRKQFLVNAIKANLKIKSRANLLVMYIDGSEEIVNCKDLEMFSNQLDLEDDYNLSRIAGWRWLYL